MRTSENKYIKCNCIALIWICQIYEFNSLL